MEVNGLVKMQTMEMMMVVMNVKLRKAMSVSWAIKLSLIFAQNYVEMATISTDSGHVTTGIQIT